MGRTVPSFRIAESQEVDEWRTFREALPKEDKLALNNMLSTARLYTSASSAAVRASRFEGLAMALIFHHEKMLNQEMERITDDLDEGNES
jgi:hypothetical protein